MRDGVAERPGHGQSRYVLVLEPDTQWSQRIVILVSERVDTASVGQDSICFILVIRLVISSQGRAIHASGRISAVGLGSLSNDNSS